MTLAKGIKCLDARQPLCFEGEKPVDFGPSKYIRAHLSAKYIRPACERAGVRRFTPHALRRAAVDAFMRAGVDIGTAAAITGHSPQVMLKYYRQATDEDCRRAITVAQLGLLQTGKVVAFPSGGSRG